MFSRLQSCGHSRILLQNTPITYFWGSFRNGHIDVRALSLRLTERNYLWNFNTGQKARNLRYGDKASHMWLSPIAMLRQLPCSLQLYCRLQYCRHCRHPSIFQWSTVSVHNSSEVQYSAEILAFTWFSNVATDIERREKKKLEELSGNIEYPVVALATSPISHTIPHYTSL